jgi:AcrR family transcriptional regulator
VRTIRRRATTHPRPTIRRSSEQLPVKTPRAGRPSRADSARLREHLLEVASEALLSQGYGATSIEEICRRARVSKRTFYHRFEDKPALMRAVVTRLVDGLRPPAHVPLIEGADLAAILEHLAELILEAALRPQALALHRLIVAESPRFPELAAAIATAGARNEAVELIAGQLRRYLSEPALGVTQSEFAAQQFLQMIVTLPQTRASVPAPAMTRDERRQWVQQTVRLFLGGVVALRECRP